MNQRINDANHHLLQLFKTPGFFSIHDPADHIFAIADLGIKITELGQNIAGNQVNQLAVDGGGADVHGNGIVAVRRIARLNVDDVGFSSRMNRPCQGSGNFKISFPEDLRNLLNYRKIHCQPVLAMFQFQKTDQAGHIRKIVLSRRHRQFQVFFLNRRNKQALVLQVFQIHFLDSGGTARGALHIQNAGID